LSKKDADGRDETPTRYGYPGELPNAIRDVLAHDGPAVLDVVTATQELSMPPAITAEQVNGFSLWVLRAVMSCRGDEVLDLAKTNLLGR